ncbi:MAG: aminotransferase [Candidatus Competibacterales bacterium]
MRLNPLSCHTPAAPIDVVRAWPASSAPGEALDLSQAGPPAPTDPGLLAHLAMGAGVAKTANYAPLLGLPALRSALAEATQARYGGTIQPSQVAITAGCNQAFCAAMGALAQAGDEVILPLPYYFNHAMWLEMQGIRAIHLPFAMESGGVPSLEAAAAAITPRTRALVLVTPNNPTGAVYPPEALAAFYRLAHEADIALVVDETYRDFLPGQDPPHGLFQEPHWPETLIQLYSFSKAYALPGYRVGALIAGEALLAQVSKFQDCIAICAPHLGQEGALYGLEHAQQWLAHQRQRLAARASTLSEGLANHTPYRVVATGVYFAYVRHPYSHPAMAVAEHLWRRAKLRILPGSAFGPGQEAFLRLALANLDDAGLATLVDRLARAGGPGTP